MQLYKNYLRMSVDNFNEILTLVKDDLTKQNTHLRESIPAEVKLAITLRYLATGNTYTDLQYQFRVHKSTISGFVPKVCEVIYEKLKETNSTHFFILEQKSCSARCFNFDWLKFIRLILKG